MRNEDKAKGTRTDIDTIDMTRRIRDAHYEELKGKTDAERIDFYNKKSETLHKELGL